MFSNCSSLFLSPLETRNAIKENSAKVTAAPSSIDTKKRTIDYPLAAAIDILSMPASLIASITLTTTPCLASLSA